MKILHTVEFYPPSVGGMQEVVRQLSERMARGGHDVTVATGRHPLRQQQAGNGVRIAEFQVSGNMVRGMTGEVERYREFVINGGFDVVVNFAAQQWATDALLPVLDRIAARKVFVPTGFSSLQDGRFHNYYQAMPGWMHCYDANVFLSEGYRDAEFARRHGIANRVLIPNGAAADEFLPGPRLPIRSLLGIDETDFLVLHVGSHTGLKGHAEAIAIFGKSRLRQATLLLVGNDNGPGSGCIDDCRRRDRRARFNPLWRLAGKRLLLKSLNRQETVAAFHAADLLLFPSRIECSPLVLFEAMASKTPFLTTAAGNAAEIAVWSQGGEILPSRVGPEGYCRAETAASARQLTALWRNPERRCQLAEAGFSAWKERFTWETIAGRYQDLYLGLLQGCPRGGSA